MHFRTVQPATEARLSASRAGQKGKDKEAGRKLPPYYVKSRSENAPMLGWFPH